MNKTVRKAVRTLLLKDDKIVVIKYKSNNKGFYDLPGGKIEENETALEAAVREFKEETGIIASNLNIIGKVMVEYPTKIFEFDIFKAISYKGSPKDFDQNKSMWINIDDLLKKRKVFPCIEILKYLDKKISLKIMVDEKHNILKIDSL